MGGGCINDENHNFIGYDQRCDVWQIAVLTYELNSGKTPFTDDGPRNENQIINNILKVHFYLLDFQKSVKMQSYFSKELISFLYGGL
jgi:serine/threonine protein kinase